MGYFDNREERKRKAIAHDAEMRKKYSKEIAKCVDESTVHQGSMITQMRFGDKPVMEVLITKNHFTDTAISEYKEPDKKLAVLNFASYRNPGGYFLGGSSAQEESLCHNSFLYEVLEQFPDYYEWNNRHLNDGYYLNRAIYSPDVFFHDGKDVADVITCAAPNINFMNKINTFNQERNSRELRSRIKFILDIAEYNKVDILILGAFGCGVFMQDATEVAEIFKDLIFHGQYKFSKVVFAVPESRTNQNYYKMESVFVG